MNGISDADDNRTQLEIYELADALVRGDITAAESDRLGRLIASDPDARAHYLRFMHDSARLCRWSSVWRNSKGSGEGRVESGEGQQGPGDQETSKQADSAADRGSPVSLSPGLLVSPSSLFPLSYFFGSVPLAYLLAAVLLGAGVLAAFWQSGVCRDRETGDRQTMADARLLSTRVAGDDDQPPPIVGYVTSAADCRWADAAAAKLAVPVAAGQKFALTSGSLEITYETGEKIILHGPATFEARWFNGGFLSQGRLTVTAILGTAGGVTGSPGPAAAARADQVRKQRGEMFTKIAACRAAPWAKNYAADPVADFNKMPTLQFFIRTPSALAISRGARFELSVDGAGATDTRLAAGVIEAWYPCGGKPNDLISSPARQTWSWTGFTPQHDVWVLYGTGDPPGALGTALAGARTPWPAGPTAGSLRIWGLESQQRGTTVRTFPARQPDRTTN